MSGFNGKIIKASCKTLEGTYRQHAYADTWVDTYDVEYDGELTDEVCTAVVEAFKGSKLHVAHSGSSYGALRYPLADSDIHVNWETRKLHFTRGQGLCD